MICNDCKKNEAMIRVVILGEGVQTERFLCKECAEKHRHQMSREGMQNMLQTLLGLAGQTETEALPTQCPKCGHSLETIEKKAMVGCAACYETFHPLLMTLLQRIHGHTRHHGRTPAFSASMLSTAQQREKLRRELEIAIALEDYEQAAIVRDTLLAFEEPIEEATSHV